MLQDCPLDVVESVILRLGQALCDRYHKNSGDKIYPLWYILLLGLEPSFRDTSASRYTTEEVRW